MISNTLKISKLNTLLCQTQWRKLPYQTPSFHSTVQTSLTHFDEKGRDEEPFLLLLNWRSSTRAADTEGEQSVPEHTSKTAEETGRVCHRHDSLGSSLHLDANHSKSRSGNCHTPGFKQQSFALKCFLSSSQKKRTLIKMKLPLFQSF